MGAHKTCTCLVCVRLGDAAAASFDDPPLCAMDDARRQRRRIDPNPIGVVNRSMPRFGAAAFDSLEAAALALERVNPNAFDHMAHAHAPAGALQLRDTIDGRGVGVFATQNIRRGVVVTEYSGDVRDERGLGGLTTHALHIPATRTCIDGASLRERLVRDGATGWRLVPPAGLGAFINSTVDARTSLKRRDRANCKMNFEPDGRCFVTSARELVEGDELLWFYRINL